MRVIGGLVMVLLLILGAYYLGKYSNSTAIQPSGSRKLGSPEAAVAAIQALCKVKKYEDIALKSLRQDGQNYVLITRQDIVGNQNPLEDYIVHAKSLCNAIANSKRTDKSQLSDDMWRYRFNFRVDTPSMAGYRVHYFQGEWRFIFTKGFYI